MWLEEGEPDVFEMPVEDEDEGSVFEMPVEEEEEAYQTASSKSSIVNKKRSKPEMSTDEYHSKVWQKLLAHSTREIGPPISGFDENCLIWQKAQTSNGYTKFRYRETTSTAHRASLLVKLRLESLPLKNENGDNLEIRHLCNNKLCIEPTHLELGTKIENARDVVENGSLRGQKNPFAKITEEKAQQIKLTKYPRSHEKYRTQKQRAIHFGVNVQTIIHIDAGHTWWWLKFNDGTCSNKRFEELRSSGLQKKQKLRTTEWTDDQWEKAKQRFYDSNYVHTDTSIVYAGNPCKIWQKYKHSGYGRISVNGIHKAAHIVACTIANNYVRPKHMQVLHKCGNKSCVEFSHLKFGTAIENAEDKIEHGTHSKISFETVKQIRDIYARGDRTYVSLAKEFNIAPTTVAGFVKYERRIKG